MTFLRRSSVVVLASLAAACGVPPAPATSAAPVAPAPAPYPPVVVAERPPEPPVEPRPEPPPIALARPRLLSPWSTMGVTSRRPTFRWVNRAETGRAVLELCRERSCAKPVHSVATDGDSAAPPKPLAPGAWWWRVRDERTPSTVTPTWRFHVGRHDGPVAASVMPRVDIDGDGRVDPIMAIERIELVPSGGPAVTHGRAARARVFLGQRGGIAEHPAVELAAGGPVSLLGDVDGDGHCDVALDGVVHLGRVGSFERTDRSLASASLVVAGGDIDGDGHADVVLARPGGGAQIHLGSSAGLLAKASATLTLADDERWPLGAALVDVDADGHGDLVSSTATAILVHRGGASGLARVADTLFAGDPEQVLGNVKSLGDVDGDGFPDVATVMTPLVAERPSTLVVIRGGKSRRDPYLLRGTKRLPVVGDVLGPGDVDGDGFDDLLVGSEPFAALLFARGGPSGPRLGPRVPAPSDAAQTLLGEQAGDVDGDGFSDAVLGEHAPIDGSTFPALFLGGARGLRRMK